MILRQYLRMMQKLWWAVAVCVLIGWCIALLISYNTVPLYRASATFLVYPNANLTSSRDMVTSLDTLDRKSVSSTYANILSSVRVFEETVRKLKLDPKQVVDYRDYAIVQTDSNILELTVEGNDPTMASLLANNIGQIGINYIKGIYQVFDISFLDQAVDPSEPFLPNPLRDGGIAAGIGLIVGMLLVVISETIRIPLEALRDRFIRDKVSGAFTQTHFRACIERELAQNQADPMSLALLELEGLEDLVGALPELVLTGLLHKVTSMLHDQLRGNDLVGRWNNTTFSILLIATPGTAATRTLERIRLTFMEPIEIEAAGERIKLNPVAGVASRHEDETTERLIQRAVGALEKASQSEDHRTVLFTHES